MNFIECPHCYNKVLVSRENICPSCQKNIYSVANNDKDLTFVLLRPGRKNFPEICIICGNKTKDLRSFSYALPIEDVSDNVPINILGVLSSILLGLGFFKHTKKIDTQYTAPICEHCTKDERLKPVHINIEQHEIKILCHKKFKEHYYKLNES